MWRKLKFQEYDKFSGFFKMFFQLLIIVIHRSFYIVFKYLILFQKLESSRFELKIKVLMFESWNSNYATYIGIEELIIMMLPPGRSHVGVREFIRWKITLVYLVKMIYFMCVR